MIDAVLKKLQNYTVRDAAVLKDSRVITLQNALNMIKEANYTCVECKTPLLLSDWTPRDPRQFSFDRLDDSLPHIEENLRITCLGCNLQKAANRYKPTDSLSDYEVVRDEFFYICKNDIDAPFRKKQLATAAAELHEKTYGDRKPHNWRSHPVEPAEPDYNYKRTYSV
jgi:hypothetical protein